MIFATLTFAGAVSLGLFLGRFLSSRKPMDAAAAVMGLALIAIAPLTLPG